MIKKIYYRNTWLAFPGSGEDAETGPDIELVEPGKEGKGFKKILKGFLEETNTRSFVFRDYDFEDALRKLREKLYYIEAAGGFIERDQEYLFIYRHNRWDLPKGKLEKGESVQRCAVRECEEECGVKNLLIRGALPSTFHIYPYKGDFAIKQTFWFYMNTTFPGHLKPQTDEDITEARWFRKEEIDPTVMANTYFTIADTVRAAFDR